MSGRWESSLWASHSLPLRHLEEERIQIKHNNGLLGRVAGVFVSDELECFDGRISQNRATFQFHEVKKCGTKTEVEVK